MRSHFAVVVAVGLASATTGSCGPSKGGSSEETGEGETTAVGTTVEGTTEVTPPTTSGPMTTSETDPTGTPDGIQCEEYFAGRDAVAGTIVLYAYGTEEATSMFQVFVDGSIYHNEQTCCPVMDTNKPETLVDAATMDLLRTRAAAVAAGGEATEDLGAPAGQGVGVMCVKTETGEVATVRSYEAGVTLTKRTATAPEAALIAEFVHGFTDVDMPP